MHPRIRWALAAAAAGVVVWLASTPPAGAQAPTTGGLTVRRVTPTGRVDRAVTQAAIYFSAPMAALGAGNEPLASYVHVTPAIPMRLRWTAADVLAVEPVAGEFPYSQTITIRIDAGARAISGASLAEPVVATFTTPAARVNAAGFRDRSGRVVVRITASQPLRSADVPFYTTVRYHPFTSRRRAPSGESRLALERREPSAPARHDEALRTARARAAWTRVVPSRPTTPRHADGTPWPAEPGTYVVETIEIPPPGTQLIAGPPLAAGEAASNRVIPLADAFWAGVSSCPASCPADAISVYASQSVEGRALERAVTVRDVTDARVARHVAPGPHAALPRELPVASLGMLGYRLEAGRRYEVMVDGALTSTTGEHARASWLEIVRIGRPDPVATFSTYRDAVFEARLGPRLPVVARSLRDVLAAVTPVPFERVPDIFAGFGERSAWPPAPPPVPPSTRVPVEPGESELQVALVDAAPALGPDGTGLVWIDALPGTPMPDIAEGVTVRPGPLPTRALVQVTNLGLTVRTLSRGLAILVTALDTGEPIPGVSVSASDGTTIIWRGTTDARGLVLTDDGTSLNREAKLVLAEYQGDHAFAEPGYGGAWLTSTPTEKLAGVVFTDRGVYRPGDAISVKAILRTRSATGFARLAEGSTVTLTLDRGNERLRSLEGVVGALGGVEWTLPIAADATLSNDYVLTVHRGTVAPPEPSYRRDRSDAIWSGFSVKELRPLEFETSVSLTSDRPVGAPPGLDVVIAAKDLTGLPLTRGHVTWRLSALDGLGVARPPGLEAYSFGAASSEIDKADGTGALVDGVSRARASAEDAGAAIGGTYAIEGEVVDDASSQAVSFSEYIAIRPDVLIGLAPPDAPVAPGQPVTLRVVAIDRQGHLVAGVPVEVTVRIDGAHGSQHEWVPLVTALEPVQVEIPAREWSAGLEAIARGTDPARWVMGTSTYVRYSPPGEPADGPKPGSLTLTLDKPRYRVGDRARLGVSAFWPRATVLLTVEGEGVQAVHVLGLHGETQTIDVPVVESAAGGLTVTATAVKGRTAPCCEPGGADPGAPAVLTAAAAIEVDPATLRLSVAIEPEPVTPMAGGRVRLRVRVEDDAHRPAPSTEVTLWAVDEGWLRQTHYDVPQIVESMIGRFRGDYATADSRASLLRRAWPLPQSETVYTTSSERGPFQDLDSDAPVRSDLRALAFWSGALRTDTEGRAEVEVMLPDTLTTYRVMAVAADRARFGTASRPLTAARPLMLRTALPRVLSRGDRATVRVTVASLLDTPTRGALSIESLTPDLLAIDGTLPAVRVAPGARETVTVGLRALQAGVARLRVRVASPEGADALEQRLPIEAPTVIERAASYGQIHGTARENVRLPEGILPDAGGLSVSVSSSLLSGVSVAGRDLEGYAYLCLEQRSSRLLALALAVGEGGPFAFTLGDARSPQVALRQALREIASFRCADGKGYGLWRGGACHVQSPYLTPYLLFALQRIRDLDGDAGVDVDQAEIAYAVAAIEASLARTPATTATGPVHASEGWRALAVKVLTDEGRYPKAAAEALLADAGTLPTWAIAHLYDAVSAAEPRHPTLPALLKRLTDAITPAGQTAHLVEGRDAFDWTWPSDTKTTAIVLDVLARRGGIEPEMARALATWLMQARRADGTWRSTQENAWALVALASYRRAIEQAGASTVAVAARVNTASLVDATLDGHDAPVAGRLPLPELRAALGSGRDGVLTLTADGERPAFYLAQLETHRSAEGLPARSHGLTIERRYDLAGRDPSGPLTSVVAGDLVKVTLSIRTPESRFLVAVSDPLPAGFEAVDPELDSSDRGSAASKDAGWDWQFDHVQLRDARVDLFATFLSTGQHEISYLVRATTPGTFVAAPPHAEAMYEPEVSGRGTSTTITVTPTP